MKQLAHHHLRPLAFVSVAAIVPLLLGAWAPPSPRVPSGGQLGATTPDAQALLTQAIHNTNIVRTLVHTDKSTVTAKDGSVAITSRGEEDEARNREHDYESVTVQALGQNGKVRTAHYTIDIIFMNGQTYYRSSLLQNKWRTHSGMIFRDPFTGGWKRGRTKVVVPKGAKFVELGRTSSGETHMHTSYTHLGYRATQDLWISAGKTPYVVRVDQGSTGNGTTVRTQTNLGPFNQTMNIQPPTVGT